MLKVYICKGCSLQAQHMNHLSIIITSLIPLDFFLYILQYLLYYLMSLRDWLGHTPWSKVPVAETAWALLRDSGLRGEAFQRFKPQHVAVGAVYLALECHGVQIPGDNNARLHWWQVIKVTEKVAWSE